MKAKPVRTLEVLEPRVLPKPGIAVLEPRKGTVMSASTISRHWRRSQSGFSVAELVLVMVVILILAAMAVPGYQSITGFLRIDGDARSISEVVAQAKMMAGAGFTHARAYADLSGNTYHIEVWDRQNGCWHTDGDASTCTNANSPVQPLSVGISFGVGSVGPGSPNPQATIQQGPYACGTGVAGSSPGTVANTMCIEFNSRGIPLDSNGAPWGAQGLYITDGNTVYGVTASVAGQIQAWSSPASSTAWTPR